MHIENKISKRTLLIISVIVLIFSNAVTYVILLSKNNEWISEVKDKKRKSTYKRKTMTWKEKVYLQGYRKAIENFKLELLSMVDNEDFPTDAQKRATIIINASKRVETMADKAKEELKEKLKE